MKSEQLFNALIALVLACCIAISAVGCVTTAFNLEVDDWTHLVCMTVFFSILCAIFSHLRWGTLALTLLALLAIALLLQFRDLLISTEKLLCHITQYYDKGYGCGYIRWSTKSLRQVSPDTALIVFSCLIVMAVCWTVCRKKWFGFGLFAGLIPLLSCCVVLDTLPDDVWLLVLLTGLLLLTLTQRLRAISIPDANRLTAMLLIPVILFSVVLGGNTSHKMFRDQSKAAQNTFIRWATWLIDHNLVPEGNISIPGVQGSLSSESVDLSVVGPLNLGDEPVLYVTPWNTRGILYLRGRSFDTYTGTQWISRQDTSMEGGWPTAKLQIQDSIHIRTVNASNIRYFSYYVPDVDWTNQLSGGALTNPGYATEYTIRTAKLVQNRTAKFNRLSSQEKEAYLQLPEDTLAAAQDILRLIGVDDSTDAPEAAELISRYVHDHAKYDTGTASMPSGQKDFAIWFLEESETGYCVHFASATAVLLRAAGIPARYVTGYMTRVVPDQECAVIAEQAHAWVEYLHPRFGWTMVESTPTTPGAAIITPPDPTDPTETTVPTESTTPSETTIPTETTLPTETTSPTESTAPTVPPPSSSVPVTTPPDPTASTANSEVTIDPSQNDVGEGQQPSLRQQLNLKWIRGILWVLAVWALVAGQYKLRVRLRKKWLEQGNTNKRAIQRWRYARRISKVCQHSAKNLLPLAEKAAYSQHEITAEELAVFDQWFPEASQALLQRPWLLQFFLRLLFAIE